MQIVIDIPENMYDGIINNRRPLGCIAEMLDAIKDGTPLPEGHGRLIDADSLDLERLYRENDDGSFSLVYTESEYKSIIEADKE